MPRPLVLVGFMGSGKSTVGAELARRLGTTLVDTDRRIEQVTGRSIPQIFQRGEAAFRELEAQVVADTLATCDGVVSLGGGAVTHPTTAKLLADHTVVFLQLDPEVGFERVRHSDRPLLNTAEPQRVYRELSQQRAEIYASVATVTVNADADPGVVAERIVQATAVTDFDGPGR